jgi:hypothetical protein
MFVGWWQILKNPGQIGNLMLNRRPSLGGEDEFIMQSSSGPKHLSMARPLGSDQHVDHTTRAAGEGGGSGEAGLNVIPPVSEKDETEVEDEGMTWEQVELEQEKEGHGREMEAHGGEYGHENGQEFQHEMPGRAV